MSRTEVTSIGKYRVLSQIGEGAMGVVYRAQDPVLNRPVAIKVMSDAVARDDDLRERFLREAQAAGSLQHPNLITIYDFGEMDGHLYIAMEYVDGDDLDDLIDKNVPLSLGQKVDILVDVLTGLSYAHRRGIIHRDIKPANIRIDDEGRGRIMDFGIAHVTASNMTRTGVMVGTPAYMAPEQIVGGPVSPATDIFSVGSVMYELLTGTKPFEGETLQTIMYKIVSQPPPEITSVVPGLPASLSTIVQRALAKEPSARYITALEMADALSTTRATLPDSSATSLSLRSTIEHALADENASRTRQAKRQRAFTIAAGAIGLLAIGLLGINLLRPPGTPALGTAASPQSPSTPPITRDSAKGTTAQQSVGVQRDTTAPSTTPARENRTFTDPASKRAAGNTSAIASDQELSVFRTLQATALQARRNARDAGASAEQLQVGDDHNRSANVLVLQGKVTQAAEQLNQAAAEWAAAERTARQAAAAASAAAASPRSSVQDPPKQQLPPPTTPVTSNAQAPAPVVSPPAPVQQSTANASAEISTVVASYARAVESRDVGALRRAYPGITPEQVKGYEDLFGSVRTLRMSLTMSGLEINGSNAESTLSGEYQYVTRSGKTQRQPITFRATFRRGAAGWELSSVR